jgi:flagellar basal-body rod protein FlgF
VPENAGELTVTRSGAVSAAQGGEVGQLQVVRFADARALIPAAGGLYVTDAPAQPAAGTQVMQGMVEDSNVQPILEMTTMMAVSRRYEAAKDMLDGEHARVRDAIDKLAKVA